MKNINRWIQSVICIGILAGPFSMGQLIGKASMRPIPTAEVVRLSGVERREFPGQIRALRRVELGFNVSGQLEYLNAAEGTRVGAGEVIARLDPRDFQFRLDNAEAAFKSAKTDFDRKQSLFRDKVISQAEMDHSEAMFLSAKAQLDMAQKALEDTVLIAPFNAVVAQRFHENFEQVIAKRTIVMLHDIDEIEVLVNIPERMIAQTKVEDVKSINVRFDADPSAVYAATISEYRLNPNTSTRTYEVTVKLKSPGDLNILTGMTANVMIALHAELGTAGTLKVPSKAVFSTGGQQSYVWIVPAEGGAIKKQAVEVGRLMNGFVEIETGLEQGQLIATAGVHSLEEGQLVRPSNADSEGLEQ